MCLVPGKLVRVAFVVVCLTPRCEKCLNQDNHSIFRMDGQGTGEKGNGRGFQAGDRLEWVSVGWANWIPEILKTLQISCKNDSTNLETRKLEPTFTLTNTVQNTKWKWKMRKRCFRAKLRQKLQICCEISFLCDFFGVRLLCCETSLLWDLLAARFLCCEVSLPWDLFAVSLFAMRSLCCETSCCETSWLWDLFGVRLLWCES